MGGCLKSILSLERISYYQLSQKIEMNHDLHPFSAMEEWTQIQYLERKISVGECHAKHHSLSEYGVKSCISSIVVQGCTQHNSLLVKRMSQIHPMS